MRTVILNENNQVAQCPMCGNNTKFSAYSNQVGPNSCNVWVECVCEYDPTANHEDYRYEDVWGGTHDDAVLQALWCWSDMIENMKTDETI
jgi:hypothetical protein